MTSDLTLLPAILPADPALLLTGLLEELGLPLDSNSVPARRAVDYQRARDRLFEQYRRDVSEYGRQLTRQGESRSRSEELSQLSQIEEIL